MAETTVETDTKTFESLVASVEPIACTVHEVIPERGKCRMEASAAIVWKPVCAGGKATAGSMVTPMCSRHRRDIMVQMRSRTLVCDACGTVVEGSAHAIERIEEL